ncbi:YciI family protein [Streptomyces tendae]|uniref:YciI family protein n=1 Tax=Streptomyces tendae TaxID=1932 RepID=UPI0037AACEF7
MAETQNMTFFLVHYSHPDRKGWSQHLEPHLDWLLDRVGDGSLVASGPTVGTAVPSALLLFKAANHDAVKTIIDTDPFMVEGQVSDLWITEWDPIFGVFHDESSQASVPMEKIGR